MVDSYTNVGVTLHDCFQRDGRAMLLAQLTRSSRANHLEVHPIQLFRPMRYCEDTAFGAHWSTGLGYTPVQCTNGRT